MTLEEEVIHLRRINSERSEKLKTLGEDQVRTLEECARLREENNQMKLAIKKMIVKLSEI